MPEHSKQPLPATKHGLHYSTPAETWDEALPLGNGMLGALIWGDGQPLRISLDRADLWDMRAIPEFQTEEYTYAQMRRWHEEGRPEEIVRLYDHPYNRAAPTKIPAGRIELTWPGEVHFSEASLDIAGAVANVKLKGADEVSLFQHATEPIGILSLPSGGEFPKLRLVAPAFSGEARNETPDGGDFGDLAALGYGAPVESGGPDWQAYVQQGDGDFRFAVYVAWKPVGEGWQAAWTVASSAEGGDPLELARERVTLALETGYGALLDSHREWWANYWGQSSLSLPNELLERHWYLDQYKFGAASRRGAPPVTLQGPWTADDGKLPPWKGDYHNDLNTQLTYWPCYTANHLEEGLSFLDWLWKIRPANQRWAQRYFGAPGLNAPGVCDLNGEAMGGWPQYSFSATSAAWLAQHFYWHWRYSGDRTFLAERAYPYLQDAAAFIEAMTAERDSLGRRWLPLSSSPEMNNNEPAAWFPQITNYDLSLMRWLMTASAELADEVAEPDQAARWRAVLAELPELALGEDGRLLIAPGYPLPESHRHMSHLMAIYPLKLIGSNGDMADVRTVQASLDELEEIGSSQWTGFALPWAAALHVQNGNGQRAEEWLNIFAEAFTLRNSFHCNGDQSGKGYSNFTYRPFTLEANFASAAALQEMLLQSDGGILRIFPAIPDSWKDVAFTTLRAEGGYLVSASRENGEIASLQIKAEHSGKCRLVSPYSGFLIEIDLEAGEDVVFH